MGIGLVAAARERAPHAVREEPVVLLMHTLLACLSSVLFMLLRLARTDRSVIQGLIFCNIYSQIAGKWAMRRTNWTSTEKSSLRFKRKFTGWRFIPCIVLR